MIISNAFYVLTFDIKLYSLHPEFQSFSLRTRVRARTKLNYSEFLKGVSFIGF